MKKSFEKRNVQRTLCNHVANCTYISLTFRGHKVKSAQVGEESARFDFELKDFI